MDGAFASIPAAMYYVIIFLGGEWGKIDFTPAGKILCVFYCIVGISICGIPVGAVFEAFDEIIEQDAEKAEEEGEEERGPLDALRPNELQHAHNMHSARKSGNEDPEAEAKKQAEDKKLPDNEGPKKRPSQVRIDDRPQEAAPRSLPAAGSEARGALKQDQEESPSASSRRTSKRGYESSPPTMQTTQPVSRSVSASVSASSTGRSVSASSMGRSASASPERQRGAGRVGSPTKAASFQVRLEEERQALNDLLAQLNATEHRVKALEKRRD